MSRTQKLLIGVVSFTLICAACWAYMLMHQFNTDNDVLRIIRERYGITTCEVVSKETIMRNGPSGELYHLLYNAPNGNSYPFTMEVNRDNGLAPTAYSEDTIAMALFSEAYDNYANDIGLSSLTMLDGLWQIVLNSQEDAERIEQDLTKINQVLLQIPESTKISDVHIPVVSDDPYLTGFTLETVDWERNYGYSSLSTSYEACVNTFYLGLGSAYGKEAPLSQDILDSMGFVPITFEYEGIQVTWDLPEGIDILLTRIPDLFTQLGIEVQGDYHRFSWEYGGETLYAGTDVMLGAYYDPLFTTQIWHEYTETDLLNLEAEGIEPSPEGGYYDTGSNSLTKQPLWYDSTIFPATYVIVYMNPDIKAYNPDGDEIEVMKNFFIDMQQRDPVYYENTYKDYFERTYGNGNS